VRVSESAVVRLDHVYVSVSDLARAERFYDAALGALGFRKVVRPIADEPHVHYFNRVMQYTIRPARSTAAADAYRPGALHHLCMQVADAAAVDAACRALRGAGVDASEPRLYPEYRPDYYATFFSDPDGIRLEIVCDTELRRLVRDHWHELTEFVDPVARLRERGPLSRAPWRRGQLSDGVAAPPQGERFDELAALRNTRIERITSSNRPVSDLYDQLQDEWVALLEGEAELDIDDTRVTLRAGEYLVLPAHTPHRVLKTTPGARWLAVHIDPV